jgi:hypothetical protein
LNFALYHFASRMCSYPFILTYIDKWSFLPLLFLIFVNLVICGLFFNSSSNIDDNAETGNEELEMNDWQSEKIEENHFDTNVIDKDKTPILFNAVAGLFFPICYVQVPDRNKHIPERTIKLLELQKSFFRIQISVFNITIGITICVIYYLVVYVDTFNYNFNVLDLSRFKFATCFLLFMCIASLLLSVDIDLSWLCSRLFACFKKTDRSQEIYIIYLKYTYKNTKRSQEKAAMGKTATTPKEKYILCKKSQNSNEKCFLCKKTGPQEKGIFCKQVIACLFSTLITFLPVISGAVWFNISEHYQPVMVFVKDNIQEVTMIGSVILPDFEFNTFDMINGTITNQCLDLSKLDHSSILVVNMSNPWCLQMIETGNIVTNISAVVVLDDTPQIRWRVSSPYLRLHKLKTKNVPVILTRLTDISGYSQYFRGDWKLAISFKNKIKFGKLGIANKSLIK